MRASITQKILTFTPINYLIICVLGVFWGLGIAKNISVIIFIPIMLLALFPFINIKYSVYSLVFLIPFEGLVKIQGMTLIKVWGIYVLVVYVARNIIENRSFGFKVSLVHKFVLLLIPIIILSTVFGIDQKTSMHRSITIIQLIVFSFLIYSTIRDGGHIDLARIFFIACGIVSIIQILIYFKVLNLSFLFVDVKTESRIQGYGGDPNRFGMTLLTALYFGMAEFILSQKLLKKIIAGILILFLIVGIVLTVSRAVILTLAITLFLFIIWQFCKKGPARFPAILILFIILLGLLYAFKTQNSQIVNTREYIQMRFKHMETATSTQIAGSRTNATLLAVKTVLKYPLGVGLDNFVPYTGQIHTRPLAAHNSIMQFAAELGIPGLICFLIILILLIQPIFVKCNSEQCNIEKILIFGFVAFFIVSLSLDIMSTKILWFLIALIAVSSDHIRVTSNLQNKNENSKNESNNCFS